MQRIPVLLSRALCTVVLGAAVAGAQLPQPALAASAPAPASVLAPRIDYETYTLRNGLTVVLSEDHRLPLVSVNLWSHVGPANEKPGRTGFAHLFEHMMYKGSKNVGDGDHLKILEGVGATELNATTGFDRTNFFETVPSNQLELALWLESDRMGFLLETLDQKKLSNQQDVVRNERRQSYENRPYGLVDEAVYQNLFPVGHPYHASIIGSHADIESVRLADVREFFRLYYAPGNASIAIVGDFDRVKTKALLEKYFGGLKAGAKVPPIDVETPPITAERRVVVHDKVELPRLTLAWLTPAIFQPGDADADLLASILGGGKTSRLYRRLVYDLQIAQDVTAEQESLMLGSIFSIEATARPGVSLERLEEAIDVELAALREQGPTPAEVERARNGVLASIVHSLETLNGRANRLNSYAHYLQDPGYLQKDIARYTSATADSIRALAAAALRRESRLVLQGVPGEKVIDDVPRVIAHAADSVPARTPRNWRARRPAAGPAGRLALPVPQRFRLDNGLTVLLVEQHGLPLISADLVVLAGSDHNPADRPGLSSFTADMLDEGTLARSSQQLADEVAMLGASISTRSSTDFSSVSLFTLRHTADQAFGLFADVALHPAFSSTEIERVRTSRLTQLVQQRDNPTMIARSVFNQALYGKSHPYGYTELGTTDAVRAITRADLESFWKAGYQPSNSALIVSGDITEAEMRVLASRHFGAWTGPASQPTPIQASQVEAGKVLVVDQPGAPQTALRLGLVAASRASPDYVPLEVLNGALGGLFSSRINLNLREKHGYTYGASTGFGFRRGPGPFVVQTSVRTDVTAPAVKEIFKEIRGVRDAPITTAELTLSRDSFARSLPGLFETTAQSSASSSELFVYGLPLDYFNGLPSSIQAVTAADVRRVARRYIDPSRIVVVSVGDRSAVEEGLRALAIGPVEYRTPD
jgi:zinc protease